MRASRIHVAIGAFALALGVTVSPAHAAVDTVACELPAGDLNEFQVLCTMGNVDSHNGGRYTFRIAWNGGNPCGPGGGRNIFTGDVTGSAPTSPITSGTALAVLDTSTGVHDLNMGFAAGPHSGNVRHSAFFQFSCPTGVRSGGQVSDAENVDTAPGKPNSAYCPYGQVNGSATFVPPVGAGASTDHTINLVMTCNGAPGSNSAGVYRLQSSGVETAGCVSGDGSATITGTGPGGVTVTGAWAFGRGGVHYFGFPPDGTGYIRLGTGSNAHVYQLALWLDVVPGASCLYSAAQVVGHGLIIS